MWYATASLAWKENNIVSCWVSALEADDDEEAQVRAEITSRKYAKEKKVKLDQTMVYPIYATAQDKEPPPVDTVERLNHLKDEITKDEAIKEILFKYLTLAEQAGYERGLAESNDQWQNSLREINL